MIQIINPEGMAKILHNACSKSIIKRDIKSCEDLFSSIADIMIKMIAEKNRNILDAYILSIQTLYYEIRNSDLSPQQKNDLEGKLFNQLFRVFQFAMDENDESSEDIVIILTQAIQSEVVFV